MLIPWLCQRILGFRSVATEMSLPVDGEAGVVVRPVTTGKFRRWKSRRCVKLQGLVRRVELSMLRRRQLIKLLLSLTSLPHGVVLSRLLPSSLCQNLTLVIRVEPCAVALSFVGLELGLPLRLHGLDLTHPSVGFSCQLLLRQG
ncbi:hypothetical protein Bca4012_067023 [Brassica carinata]|uniref:Uncharacterized protein n=1 Tax=Brassica carinata TaxID=52824 RepID=A0A8X8B0A8_BRACI|nr:hypothetical protein Bca52824_019334 [Brassica carinata]